MLGAFWRASGYQRDCDAHGDRGQDERGRPPMRAQRATSVRQSGRSRTEQSPHSVLMPAVEQELLPETQEHGMGVGTAVSTPR